MEEDFPLPTNGQIQKGSANGKSEFGDFVLGLKKMVSAEGRAYGINFNPPPGAIMVAGHPKCGTSWLQQVGSLSEKVNFFCLFFPEVEAIAVLPMGSFGLDYQIHQISSAENQSNRHRNNVYFCFI